MKEKKLYLDVLRILAILMVFHLHFTVALDHAYGVFFGFANGNWGNVGTSLFFLISGNCLARNYGEKLNIVMLHDVLVSGERIYKSLEKLPKDSYELIGLFSLVYYKTNNNPYAVLDSHGIPQNKIHNILEVSDEDMEVIVSEKDT